MHQLPRPRAKPAAAAPSASNDGRPIDRARVQDGFGEQRLGVDAASRAVEALQDPKMAAHSKEAIAKLNQIIQNYFIKAALIIVHSRMTCPPSYNKGTGVKRVNKWFNVEIDETDIFRDDWRIWKTCDADAGRPPPMIIETYLDLSLLTKSQTLVLVDDQGKQWNVDEMLNFSPPLPGFGRPSGAIPPSRASRVILERWTIQLGDPPADQPPDLNGVLPVVYKKSIVLFRSLFTYSKFLPAWKFARQTAKSRQVHSSLKLNCRIMPGNRSDPFTQTDALKVPLNGGGGRVTEDFSFGATDSPAGAFSVSVTYRTNCEFRVDDSETLLSSQFMGIDDQLFRPSLGEAPAGAMLPPLIPALATKELGSLPSGRRETVEIPDRSQAYGSLSSFHQVAPPTASSPISTLRAAAKELGPESESSSPPARPRPSQRSTQSSKSSLRSAEDAQGVQRRPSVSFMPFKTPSLSASPSHVAPPPSPRNLHGRTPLVSALTQARNRTSVEVHVPSSLRGPPNAAETPALSSASASPRPASVSRYSSSFGHRRGRLSSGSANKPEDDPNGSSGRASQTSLQAPPGSGTLAEAGTGGSSGSLQTDDDNISDFLKLLETKKTLKSFEAPRTTAGADASGKRTSTALSKFQKMRDSHAALLDSMSSSLVLQRSSSTSSRQLSSLPPMVAGTSMSPCSSPGKPISPHTPHTPAVPSRLSAHSVAVYAPPPAHQDGSDDRQAPLSRNARDEQPEGHGQASRRDADVRSAAGSHAIDIPRSPRPVRVVHDRRSSSAAQRHQPLAIEDETGDLLPFGMRSASLGAHERPGPPSFSALLGQQETSDGAGSPPPSRSGRPSATLTSGAQARKGPGDEHGEPMSRQSSLSSQASNTAARGGGAVYAGGAIGGGRYRPRLAPRTGSAGVVGGAGSGAGAGGPSGAGTPPERSASARHSFSRPGAAYEEDEPLLFAMSEIGGPTSRRSLEDGGYGR